MILSAGTKIIYSSVGIQIVPRSIDGAPNSFELVGFIISKREGVPI